MDNIQLEKEVSLYWHEIMDDISWYSKEDEAYILARLIAKMATEMTALIKRTRRDNILSLPGREKYIIHLPKNLLTNGARYDTIGLPKGRKEN